MPNPNTVFTAIVLAADRGPADPVAAAAGVRCKSMAPVGGTPMVFRVLDALASSRQINARILCGPPKSILDQEPALNTLIASGQVQWFENQATPSLSALHVLQTLPDETPVLLTTSDHALLNAQMVDYFCSHARQSGCDVVVGVARHETVTGAYPQTRRTVTRLQDGAYCGCNLFAFLTPRARQAAVFWRRVESQRKKPLFLIRVLGLVAIAKYLLGRLSMEEALQRVSQRLGFRAGAVTLPFAEAAIDVDTAADWKLVEKIVSSRNNFAAPDIM
jgi:GTP:adenosylcobinamide-phosphate guanylyltransferase